jgi:D-tyrosyl-tRNA(Tyr) deacylase
MRALLQRVTSASVVVEGATVGAIEKGILALVGVGRDDTADDAEWIVRKVLGLRLFEGAEDAKPWAASVASLDLSVLLVSQFTLHASCKKTKPDFHRAQGPDEARRAFDDLVASFRRAHKPERIQTGSFGAYMAVSLVNDGPVTVWLDSKNREDVPFPLPSAAQAIVSAAPLSPTGGMDGGAASPAASPKGTKGKGNPGKGKGNGGGPAAPAPEASPGPDDGEGRG